MPSQLGIPQAVRADELEREKTLGGAIELCAKVAGFSLDKELQTELGVDKAQFSRWQSGTEGIVWPKLERLMDTCGNDAPLLWMLQQRGWDVASLRRTETETERLLRETEDKLKAERAERVAVEAAMRRMIVGSAS